VAIFGVQSTSKFNYLQLNSLRKRTGNYFGGTGNSGAGTGNFANHKGSGGPLGDHNGNFKHGLYTREAKTIRRVMRAKVREIKALIQAADPGKQ
jgi:hypothetical protein